MYKTIGISLVVSLLVLWLGFTVRPPKTVVNQVPGNGGNLGALASPDIPSPYLKWGDVAIYQNNDTFDTGTSTLCVLASPAATSTLERFTVQPTTSTSTAYYGLLEKRTIAFAPSFSVATSANVLNATTTSAADLVQIYPAALTTAVIWNATSTDQSVKNDFIGQSNVFAPNTYAVYYAKSGVISQAGTGSIGSGRCKAIWQEL